MGKSLGIYIEENKDVFKNLVKARQVPVSAITNFRIYVYYSGLTGKSKMQNYQDTAQAMNSSLTSVRRAIKEMEKSI